ncbi:MAG: mechanosensitive ion channel [candidate division Zixibacteria bacterium]|nr:mechanosensitive ion channel [candidate division Zixibacteria bacterium]
MTFWEEILLPAFQRFYGDVAETLPNIVAAMAILVAGWLIARGTDILTRRILKTLGFNRLVERAGVLGFFQSAGYPHEPSWIMGKVFFWLLLLTFILTAAETMEFTVIAVTMQKLVAFIPNLIAVLLIVVFGSLFARVLSSIVRGAASDIGVEFSDILARGVHALVLIMVLVMAFSELEIHSLVLEITFASVLGAFGLAVALTLGLGSRSVAQNILAGVYARRSFQEGQRIRIRGHQGEVVQIGTVNTVLHKEDGSMVTIPNALFIMDVAVTHEVEASE